MGANDNLARCAECQRAVTPDVDCTPIADEDNQGGPLLGFYCDDCACFPPNPATVARLEDLASRARRIGRNT